jgi:hypothetical protein
MNKKGVHWLKHSICIHPFKKIQTTDDNGHSIKVNHFHWHTIKEFDYPSWITKKWAWYINFWKAKMQVRFPTYYITHRVYGYWPEADADFETQKKRQISAAKGQVSKVLSIMEERRKLLSTQLFQVVKN